MTTSTNNQLSQYKGEWQPLTEYKQYDLVHDGTSLWVADSDFTSGATFDELNWTCPACEEDGLPYAMKSGYALVKLSSSYSGQCVRVRRDSDNAELDIGFDGSVMDVAALTSFVGVNSGYVATWYDQGVDGNDMVQTDTSKQPLIVDVGSVQTDNGMPTTIHKVGSSNKGLVAGVTSYNFPTSIYSVCRPQSDRCVLFTDNPNTYIGGMSQSGVSGYIVVGQSSDNYIINNNVVTPKTRGQVYTEFSLSQGIFGLQNLDMIAWTQLRTGTNFSIGPYESIQAFIVFDADTTPDGSTISAYLNGIYGAY